MSQSPPMPAFSAGSVFSTDREFALRRFATVLTGDPRTATEIVGDVLSRADMTCDRVGGFNQRSQTTAYLRAMVVDEYFARCSHRSPGSRRIPGSHRIRGSRRPAVPCAELLEVLDAGDDEILAEREALDHELAALPRKLRAVLVLRFYEQVPEAEIAAILRCRLRSVRRKTTRARQLADDLTAAFGRLAQLTPNDWMSIR